MKRSPARLKPPVLLVAFASMAGLACGSSGGGGTSTVGDITISGTLVAGSVTTAPTSALVSAATSATPLSGYKLYCVTFRSPPVAASGTADSSGNVSVTLAAQGLAFGCFVQDPAGSTVATLSFQGTSVRGTTLTASADTSLGDIEVDTSTGLATASVSTGTVAATPTGAACPAGYWIFQTGASECSAGQTTAQVWVAPASGGGYTVSIIHGPSFVGSSQTCGFDSFTTTGTYANGALTVAPFTSNPGSNCPNTLQIVVTPDASCTTATAAGTFEGCGSCGAPGASDVCAGNNTGTCGTATCNASWSGSRIQ